MIASIAAIEPIQNVLAVISHFSSLITGYRIYIRIQVTLLQNLITWARSIQQFAKFYFTKGGLADNLPNFPTTKVSLHTVY